MTYLSQNSQRQNSNEFEFEWTGPVIWHSYRATGHSCSTWITPRMCQDLPVSWPTLTVNPKSLDAITPPAQAKGRGRGRGRGTAKGKGEETQPLPKAKTQKKTTMSLLSSLVRTGNQMSNSGSWQIALKQVKKIMADQLVLHSSDDLAGDCSGRLALNRSILVMLGKLNQDSSGAPSSVPASLQNSAEELLEFLGSKLPSSKPSR